MTQSSIGMSVGIAALGQNQGGGEQLVPAGAATPAGTTGATGTVAPGGTATQGAQQAAPAGMGNLMLYIPVVLLVVFMLWSSSRTQKKEQARRQEMMKGLHRGDKVQTIGGVIGTIADIFDEEVVLTVEQGRIRVTKAAVQQVVRPSGSKAEAVVESKPEANKTATA